MKVLDLFSGIGGFSYGLEMASKDFKTTKFCEIDKFCQKVLRKHWPEVPIHDDIRTLTCTEFEFANGKLVKLEEGDEVSEDGIIYSKEDKK